MGYLDDSEEQKKQQPDGSDPTGQSGGSADVSSGGGSSSQVPSGQSADVGTGGVSTAGVGAGGQGGWTNIQAYVNANQGQNGSADALNKQVGGAFDNEAKNFQDTSSQARTAADQAAQPFQWGDGEQSQLLNQAWGGSSLPGSVAKTPDASQSTDLSQAPSYQDIVSRFQGSLGDYGGPSQYAYGKSQDFQDYGQNLQTDQGFGALMNGVYDKAAGGKMGTGGLALQNQLDTNNQAVQDARQSLMQKYAGINGQIDQGTKDTNDYVSKLAGDATSAKSTTQNLLSTQQADAQRAMDMAAVEKNRDAATAAGTAQDLFQKLHGGDKGYTIGLQNPNVFNGQNSDPQDLKRWNTIQDILKTGQQKQAFDAPQSQYVMHTPDQAATIDYNKPVGGWTPGTPGGNQGMTYDQLMAWLNAGGGVQSPQGPELVQPGSIGRQV